MKTLNEYWSDDSDVKEQNTSRRVEILKLSGKRHVMDAQFAYIKAQEDQDEFIHALRNDDNPDFGEIIDHVDNVTKARAKAALVNNTYNSLFPEENAS